MEQNNKKLMENYVFYCNNEKIDPNRYSNFIEYKKNLRDLKENPLKIINIYHYLIFEKNKTNVMELQTKFKITPRKVSNIVNIINNSNLFHIPIISCSSGYYIYNKKNKNKSFIDIDMQNRRAIEVLQKNNKIQTKIRDLEKEKIVLEKGGKL